MAIAVVHLSKIVLLVVGLSVHQSKSDVIHSNGIIMNGANEPEDSAIRVLADGSIDKIAVQQPSVEDDNHDVTQHSSINGSIQQQQIGSDQSEQFNIYLSDFLVNHPGAIVVQPKDKEDNKNYEFRFEFPEAPFVEVIIHLLDINPYANYLLINATSTTEKQAPLKFSEHIEAPNVKRVIFTNVQKIDLLFNFKTSEWNRYHGFLLTIQPLAISQYDGQPVNSNSSEPNHFNADSISVETLKLLIEVPKAKQINETWHRFQVWLANSTNKFINATGINAENCSADNVTLNNIYPCRAAWPNKQNCVEMDFSLQLNGLPETSKPSNTETNQNNDQNVGNSTELFTFNRDALIHIWIEFGRDEFADNGFKEFPVPEAGKLLFLWSTVSVSVVGVFLLILAGIWKMDILRDYRRMYWKNNDDEKQICKPSDMSMYPPVHQIVPTLFPNDLNAANNSTNALSFEYINRPITFNASDFNRRPSLEESLKPSGNLKRKAGEVPFQSDSEFNESKQDRPEDEMYFNSSGSTSPRLVH